MANVVTLDPKLIFYIFNQITFLLIETIWPWSSLVEGDEQLDRPNSQTILNYAMHVLHKIFGFNINTTAFCLGRSSIHLLLLKSSMI